MIHAFVDKLQHVVLNVAGNVLTLGCLVPALAVAVGPRSLRQSSFAGRITQCTSTPPHG